MIIPIFEKFYPLSCGLVIACHTKWNQTCGKSEIVCFCYRFSTFRPCTGLYKLPQENCGNTDVILYLGDPISRTIQFILWLATNESCIQKISPSPISTQCKWPMHHLHMLPAFWSWVSELRWKQAMCPYTMNKPDSIPWPFYSLMCCKRGEWQWCSSEPGLLLWCQRSCWGLWSPVCPV